MYVITPTELASYLETEETPALQMKCLLANGIISDLPYTDAIPTPIPTRVKAIALEVAGRAVRNPDGYASEGLDDFRGSRNSATAEAGVYLTPSERAELLTIGSATVTGTAYTVRIGSPADTVA